MRMERAHHSPIDVQNIMREIRQIARAEFRDYDELTRASRRNIPAHLPAALARLRASTTALEEAASRLGEVPPGPPTMRAQVGALGVRIAQRGLFWFLPALRSSQQSLVQALREHVIASDEILKALQRTNVELELLRRSLTPPAEAAEPSGREAWKNPQ